MTPIFQDKLNIIDGNCLQAVVASLLNLKLGDVPNFATSETWWQDVVDFFRKHGYYFDISLYNGPSVKEEYHIKRVLEFGGIDGYFWASVPSPAYFNTHGTYHAIIVDKFLNIIHDPNPGYSGIVDYPTFDRVGYHGIDQIHVFTKIEN